ncbi:MAG: radical SAM protein [Candidatus Krumholzibacteriia bacterium]
MLLVREIYPAIMGESRASGWPCAIVRLTGCHRRCSYCDTAYAFQGGERLDRKEILHRVAEIGLRTVLVTGGEPLLQEEVCELMADLQAVGHTVVIETSGTTGATALDRVPAGVMRVVDVKAPGSGLAESAIDWAGIAGLGADDELKIVCCDRRDYLWARDVVRSGRLPAGVPVTFSPAWGEVDARRLAEWVLADRLDVRVQVQLHRLLWPEAEGGV